MTEKKQERIEKKSKHNFFFETPLYEVINLAELEEDTFGGDVDAYSSKNGSDTTYRIKIEGIDNWTTWVKTKNFMVGFYLVTLSCKRKEDDVLRFIIFRNREIVFKIGQYPSLADLQYAEIGKKYDRVLPEQDLRDLKKAIGLMAHGAGAGSIVYLRRIFENIIRDTYDKFKDALGISYEEFYKKRMDEKVNFLKDYLPSQLVEMKAIYGILSKGVHELSEEDCLNYFPALKLSIILILDQRIEEETKIKRDEETKKAIMSIAEKINEKR